MTIFISGGAKNGKSTLAQDLAVSLSRGESLYYVATMIPTDAEDHDRIRRHVEDRAGLNFETIECGHNILSCLDAADPNGTFLVDSATALLQNALFPADNNYQMDVAAAEQCADDLASFAKTVCNAVIVSDYIYSDAARYDQATEVYRKLLADIDRKLAQVCDTVIEVAAGSTIVHKGDLPI